MKSKESTQNQDTSTFKLVKRLVISYLPAYKVRLIGAWLFMGLDAMMTGLLALLMEPVFDHVFEGQDRSRILPIALAVFFTFFVRGIATYMHGVQMNHIGQGIVAKIQRQLYGHLMHLDLSFFHNTASGKLISSMVNDVNLMRNSVAECLTAIGKNVITLIFLVGLMFKQDALLAFYAFFVFPLAAVFVARMSKKLRKVSRNTQSEMGHFSTILGQTFQGIRHVKAYNMEDVEEERIAGIVKNIFDLTHKSYKVSAISQPIGEVLSAIAIVTVIVYGGYQIMSGERTAGELMSFITAFLLAYEPMKRLARLNGHLQAGLAAADRVFDMLAIKPEIVNQKDKEAPHFKTYDIAFDHISFSYKDQENLTLDDVNLVIPHGKMVALVGASGAGKSTLLNLIPRFYEQKLGKVMISGHDIRDFSLRSLRQMMSLVSQEIVLFDDTVRNNIMYGTLSASEEEIIKAAQGAAAHDFIMNLPQGYDTVIGEHGVKLSGGQRQRISIARAMLKNAPILLLDEATSSLDTDSEKAVQQALKELQKGRTTLVIAHRLSTIVDADYIYVLDRGRVIEQGTHDSLLREKGIYAKLYGLSL